MTNIYQKGNIKTSSAKNDAIEAIKTGEKIESIAERFGLSVRTVFRYMDEIKALDPNFEYEQKEGNMPKERESGSNKDQLPVDPPEQESPAQPPAPGTTSTMQLDESGLTFQVTMPPLVFTLFDMAKARGLIKEDTDLSGWLFESALKRFQLDYRLQFQLVSINEEE